MLNKRCAFIHFMTFLLLMYLLRTSTLISNALNNTFEIPLLPFEKLIFGIIPFFILINYKRNEKIVLPYIKVLLIFILTHYLMEKYLYSENYNTDYDLLKRVIPIYLGFIALANIGNNQSFLSKILQYSALLLLFNTTLVYLSIIGIIQMGNLTFINDRLSGTMNYDLLSEMNVLGIYITIIIKEERLFLKIFSYKLRTELIVGYFTILIFVNASRGAMLLLLISLIVYLIYKWNKMTFPKRSLILVFSLFILFYELLSNNITDILINIHVVDRILQTNTEEGRYLQIIGSWNNFLLNPIVGVGYLNASSYFYEYTRSNFQYSQILASGGIVLFIIYSVLTLKMYGASLIILKKNVINMCLFLFIIIHYIFARPEGYYAVIAYLVYYYKYFYRNND